MSFLKIPALDTEKDIDNIITDIDNYIKKSLSNSRTFNSIVSLDTLSTRTDDFINNFWNPLIKNLDMKKNIEKIYII